MLEAPVVREDDVKECLGELGREVRDLLDCPPHDVVAARDLADQPAGIVQADAAGVARVGVELADVVQQRAAQRELAIDAGERARRGQRRVSHLERVLEQTAAVRVVVVLGGERVSKRAAAARPGAEETLHQSRKMLIVKRRDVVVEPALKLRDRNRRRVQ